MDYSQMCERLLRNMNNLYLAASQVSYDRSPVKISEREKYATVCQGAGATIALMCQIFTVIKQGNPDIFYIENPEKQQGTSSADVIIGNITLFPQKYRDVLMGFRLVNYSVRLSPEKTDRKLVDNCANSFDIFEEWFMKQLEASNDKKDEITKKVLDSKFSLTKTISQPEQNEKNIMNDSNNNISLISDQLQAFFQDSNILAQVFYSKIMEGIGQMGSKVDAVGERVESKVDGGVERVESKVDEVGERVESKVDAVGERVESKIDELYVAIHELNEDIISLQGPVSKQLDNTNDEEEIEKIIAEFSDRCIENIMSKLEKTRPCSIYEQEKTKLKDLFKNSWNKMGETSQSCLVTARVLYNQLAMESSQFEFSGVCVSVTKALEIELKRRFYFDYLDYLRLKYSGSHSYNMYPKNMLKSTRSGLRPTLEKDFTLGSVPYVLRKYFYRTDDCWESDEVSYDDFNDEKQDSKEQLIDYCKDTLFSNMGSDDIWSTLQDYAKMTHKVAEDYRNPATHTGEVHQIKAQECFEYMLDVEKIMKIMLDSFDY